MYKLYTIAKNKTGICGFWHDENGKIFRDKIRIENVNGENLYKKKKALFSNGEKSVFYIAHDIAIIENANGKKEFLRNKILWHENKLKVSLVKALLCQHNGLTIYKRENGYLIELWKK
jgi:hypothetical protein